MTASHNQSSPEQRDTAIHAEDSIGGYQPLPARLTASETSLQVCGQGQQTDRGVKILTLTSTPTSPIHKSVSVVTKCTHRDK